MVYPYEKNPAHPAHYRPYVLSRLPLCPQVTSQYSIRSIQDKRYKLIVNLSHRSRYVNTRMMKDSDRMWTSWLETIRTDQHAAWLMEKYCDRPEYELYDKQAAPWELHNLAADPQYATLIKDMNERLQLWMKEQGDTGESMDID